MNTQAQRLAMVAVILWFGLTHGSAYAGPTFDLATQFSITNNNPNGVWSYGYTTTLGGPLHLYPNSGTDPTSGLEFWRDDSIAVSGAPAVEFNPNNFSVDGANQVFAPHQAAFHPGVNGEDSVYEFTTPTTGTYALTASFVGVQQAGTTTDVHILLNGTTHLFDSEVTGFGDTSLVTFPTASLLLAAGDRVDFAVGFGTDGNFFGDGTGVAATLTLGAAAIPEPASLWMLGTAICAGLAYGWSRRRRA